MAKSPQVESHWVTVKWKVLGQLVIEQSKKKKSGWVKGSSYLLLQLKQAERDIEVFSWVNTTDCSLTSSFFPKPTL